ncbi:MAG: PilZ domain-containing protein [Nitrospirae bacterium]|nr:PilZ domain-containing protein [Nitrospirota bacterium]
MERRKFKRFSVQGDVEGNIVLKADIDIIDISLNGMLFLITKNLNTNSRCRINLGIGKTRVSLDGIVIRSSLKDSRQIQCDFLPVYEVAVKFVHLSDKRKSDLQKIIDHLKECSDSTDS